MNELNDFLKNEIDLNSKDTVVIGLSGGPDSMALVDIISKKYKDIKIVCAHVHHNLRKESDEEAVFVEKYCLDNGFKFEFFKIKEYKNNKFSEEEARRIRYDFFESIVYKYKAKYLFTAHHGDDLIETVLMRLTRGSTLMGYSGINIITCKDNYKIIRPLLFLTKDDILNYLHSNKIAYVTDNSNSNLKYTRNRYRTNILPILKQENKNVHSKFLKFSKMLENYDRFLNTYVDMVYDNIVKSSKVDIEKLIKEDELVQKLVMEKYIYSIYGDDIVFWDDNKTNILFGLINNSRPNITVDLPNNIKGIKEYNLLYMCSNPTSSDYFIELNDKVVINDRIIEKVYESNLSDNNIIYLNSCDIKLPLYVRNYRQSDKMIIKNMTNSKKVKDIFINEKVPKTKRNQIPIVVDANNNILWIPGIKKSNFDSQKSGKYDIILRYY